MSLIALMFQLLTSANTGQRSHAMQCASLEAGDSSSHQKREFLTHKPSSKGHHIIQHSAIRRRERANIVQQERFLCSDPSRASTAAASCTRQCSGVQLKITFPHSQNLLKPSMQLKITFPHSQSLLKPSMQAYFGHVFEFPPITLVV